ncbi:MAG: hypothetical protein DLM53_09640 [Candidatus Eremiobacter antarcticus]|nr:hypothetical protein [Candidatus Eremiobacteraeota bacterium]MBC5807465.1 hypothetical protein [Candidatus Eremiobacteraeota bacterium]PZR61474.1 MAG: hypothetical protein DLM53_09640 [Candidatus Eremiobacter sp. RRmetagenome_bin22]
MQAHKDRSLSFFAVAVCVAGSLVAACGGGGGGGAAGPFANGNGNNALSSSPAPGGSPVSCPLGKTWFAKPGTASPHGALQGWRFYPPDMTVNVGDVITWQFTVTGEPHTVTFPGGKPLPPPGDPSVAAPVGGHTYDGTNYISSGFMFAGQSYSVQFTKAGTYKFYCLNHGPEMQGTIVVNDRGSAYPKTQADYDAQGASLMATDLSAASGSVAEFPFTMGGTHLAAGIAPGLTAAPPSNSSVLRFLDGPSLDDGPVSVAVGTTVTWTNESNNAPHTVTFPIAGQDVPPSLPPFAPPSGGNTYDGSTLVNSGVLLPGGSFSLTFTKAGTFKYACIFHDDEGMVSTVTVH